MSDRSVPLLDLRAQHATIRDEVMSAVESVIEGQRFIMGHEVSELECAIAGYCGTADAVACASGTDALLLTLKCLDLEVGDEVITTPFTFFATAGAIWNAGGRPVFVDIDPDTYNIDPAAIERAITPRTRAILPVHLFGQMARLEAIGDLAAERGIPVIEDAAQSIGSYREIDGKRVQSGSYGLAGAISFFPSKNLGGWGDGGIIVTNDGDLATRLRRLRTHGGARKYYHEEVGTNSRLDTIQAAVLRVKLKHLNDWAEARAGNAAKMNGRIGSLEGITTPVVDPGNSHVYHQYTIRAAARDDLQSFLKDRGVGSAVYYPTPLHLQPCFSELGYGQGQFPVSEQASKEVLSLPVYPEMTSADLDYVASCIEEFANGR